MNSFIIDTHVHTAEVSPCGKLGAAELVDLYRKAAYHGLIITDHFSHYCDIFSRPVPWADKIHAFMSGYRRAHARGREAGVKVFFGIELTIPLPERADYLLLGVDKAFLLNNPDILALSLRDVKERTRDRNILIIQAHPFRSEEDPLQPHLLDGIEIFNGNPRQESRNHRAAVFAREHGLLELSGSDTHQKEDVARGGIILPGMPSDTVELAAMIRKGLHRCIEQEPVVR
jgi:hypothetical protein